SFGLRFDSDGGNEAIAQLWGRGKIKQLMLKMTDEETPEEVDAVTNVALGYRLMSKYTAFVAVSDEPRVGPNTPSRQQAVKQYTPDGMVGVPEPSLIWGLLLLGWYMGWKQWMLWRKNKKLSEDKLRHI
ncbi:MAG: PEP-CTERM sorting domain-containing protein, partial [Okeania sp. SIO2H7]|nr:PEP-CTERM sorting domain-containing protein [Okeania sp. SIO2H7]